MAEQQSNRTLFSARNMSFVVLFFAILVSGYLSYLKIDTSAHAVCVPGDIFDCGTVLNSVYSEILGIPIAWLGLGVNIFVLVLLILETRGNFLHNIACQLSLACYSLPSYSRSISFMSKLSSSPNIVLGAYHMKQ